MRLSEWRDAARKFLASEVPPHLANFSPQDSLFAIEPTQTNPKVHVPKAFLDLVDNVAMHRDPDRWNLLYRTLWRLTHGEKHLLEVDVDPDVHHILMMEKAVRRDIHKMHAFVRFRKVEGDGERYVAWYRPDHYIVENVGPWFARRFGAMHWTILTPDQSVTWDLQQLHYGPGVPRSAAPSGDELEDLWRDYYASIFNPARLKIKAMVAELPVRHWATLPEAQLIPSLIAEAQSREEAMREKTPPSAASFLPEHRDLPSLSKAVQTCQGCDLYKHATQAVFGAGPSKAAIMFVGEQPGDQEDLAGKPFVGPAGQLWDRALEAAGIPRDETYVTNAVKHFKFEERGKRRLHKKPRGSEVAACRPWLDAEIAAVNPRLIVALGGTAALSLAGREVSILRERGQFLPLPNGRELFLTVHPSFLLRQTTPEQREAEFEHFVADLRQVASRLQPLRER